MERHICAACGGNLEKQDGGYRCIYCRATYSDDGEEAAAKTLAGLLDEVKLERLANARRLLYEAAHAPNPSSSRLKSAAEAVLALYPDDPMGRFYLDAVNPDPAVLNAFLANVQLDEALADEVVGWMKESMEARNADAFYQFVSNHFAGAKRKQLHNFIEGERHALDEGVYEPSLPRDVFLAYSSADIDRVREMVDFLENEGFTVFAAYRNLRHGKGAEENYLSALQTAMRHCKAVVFLSSVASRKLSCDALTKELPFIDEEGLPMKRIEFILDEYGPNTPTSAKLLLKEFFDGLEWCTEREDLVARLLNKAEPVPKKPGKKNEPVDPRLVIEGNVLLKFDPSRPAGDSPEYVHVPEGIVEIGRCAFANLENAGIRTLYLPKSVGVIGRQAFMGVKRSGIEAIEIPADSQLQRIEESAFERSEFDHIDLPDGLRFIGHYAFYAAERLEDIYIPQSVETIGRGAFARYFLDTDPTPRYHIHVGREMNVRRFLFSKKFSYPEGYAESCFYLIPLNCRESDPAFADALNSHHTAFWGRSLRNPNNSVSYQHDANEVTAIHWGAKRK